MKQVSFGNELLCTYPEQIPGHLLVKISNLKVDKEKLRFFGVEESGRPTSGIGVPPARVKQNNNQETIAWFDINQLTQYNQFTEATNECVLLEEDRELARKRLNHHQVIYL